jgi:23S rRNA pseudouridine955/2504/2580 synthase
MRLDRWLRKTYPALTQGAIEKHLRLGKIRVDGRKVTASTRVIIGQKIDVPDTFTAFIEKKIPSKSSPTYILTSEDEKYLESMILWEDEEIMVLNKPAGLASQGGSKTDRHLDGLLSAYGKKRGVVFRLVHRLDRDTSGVFVVAKTLRSATFLGEAFQTGKIQKIYWAIVVGQPKPGQGVINAPLLKGGEGNKEKVAVNEAGKPAITKYRTLKGLQRRGNVEFTWLELVPQTGRTHQLRVHMAYAGCPIVGDGKYGGKVATQQSRQLQLHARSITIPDPTTEIPLTFMAPLPSHISATLQSYKIDWEKVA